MRYIGTESKFRLLLGTFPSWFCAGTVQQFDYSSGDFYPFLQIKLFLGSQSFNDDDVVKEIHVYNHS